MKVGSGGPNIPTCLLSLLLRLAYRCDVIQLHRKHEVSIEVELEPVGIIGVEAQLKKIRFYVLLTVKFLLDCKMSSCFKRQAGRTLPLHRLSLAVSSESCHAFSLCKKFRF